MPDLATYRRMLSAKGNKINQAVKNHSDMAMEMTWDHDIQSKVCYIYDYYHDDQKDLNKGMTYENTTKTQIDAKFIVTQYATIAKDQVEYHIMFRPSQPVSFSQGDELFYYEENFSRRYGAEFPIGLYIDIPDEKNVYHKWLICAADNGNQFIKYSILPCNYNLKWIEQNGHQRIKRAMWGVLRTQNSYNSGLWRDYIFQSVENQDKFWLPMNEISGRLFYTHINGDRTNQRIIISALVENPIVWQISKIENIHPLGLQKVTIVQDQFNPDTDYVNLETGEMYADYYDTNTEIVDGKDLLEDIAKATISCNTNTIKAGGSYKLFKFNVTDRNGKDITAKYEILPKHWHCYIDGEDVTASELITMKAQTNPNETKIKFADNKSYLTKILTVSCEIDRVSASIEMEIIAI